MKDYTKQWMREMLSKLNLITVSCDEEMHEPNVTARIVGFKLDNAMGDCVIEEAVENGWQELVVIIDDGEKHEIFNLASLIALARKAII